MATADHGRDSRLSATGDVIRAMIGFTIIWYPMVSLSNTVLGSPVTDTTVKLLVAVLALGVTYPVVAGDWSLGQLGEYIFALIASVFLWGVIGMALTLAADLSFAGSNRLPQAAVWGTAYLTAYILVYRTKLSIFH